MKNLLPLTLLPFVLSVLGTTTVFTQASLNFDGSDDNVRVAAVWESNASTRKLYQEITPGTHNILYVNVSVSGGTGDGSSWANALPQLAEALKYARTNNNYTSANPLKIYVAKGTYKPLYNAESNALTSATDRSNAFVMVANVQIYGGFDPDNGIDDLTDTRNYTNTILSGDIGTANDNTDNTYHVVISSGNVGTALLDGFTISGAYSTSSDNGYIIVNSNAIYTNYGGGMHNRSSSPTVTNCTFSANTAYQYGGGMYNTSSLPPVSNCSFTGNTATNGGGMYNQSSSLSVTNSSFTGNTASGDGGGMYNIFSSPGITNCSYAGNSANQGGAVYNSFSSSPKHTNTTMAGNGSTGFYTLAGTPVLQNSIVWDEVYGNYSAKYSLIKDKTDTTNVNINAALYAATDIFTNYSGGDYTLKSSSPAINTGNNGLFTGLSASTPDLAGNPRVYNYANGGVIDLGAYEYQNILPDSDNIIYVNVNVSGGIGDGSSWANALRQLANALKYARTNNNYTTANPLKIYVAKGTYKPLYNAASNALTSATDRSNAFVMVSNVQIYGGFDPDNGIDDLTDTRSYTNTILSGDIGTAGTATDNTYHVVISSGDIGTALLDGFIISGAYSASSDNGYIMVNSNAIYTIYGGGMHNRSSSPTVTNCTFSANTAYESGGGMYNRSSSPPVSNCSFTTNTASSGGGMYNQSSSLSITTSSFTGNTASSEGGGMYNIFSSPGIINCSYTGNSAATSGGAMYNSFSSSPKLTNTTMAGNSSTGFYTIGGTLVLQNSIIWDEVYGNYSAKYSLIKDKTDTTNANINAALYAATDIFTNYSGSDYTLKSGSPAINRGNNTLYPGLDANTQDLAGNPRLVGTTIDLGAYESPDGALPVRWISFEGRVDHEQKAVLTWKVVETNVSHYEAERSANAKDFHRSGTVIANGAGPGSYSLTDPTPVSGTVYYRIRQVDLDGTFSYSRMISLTCTGHSKLLAYPNPVKDNVIIELGPEYIGSKVRLVSTAGIVLQQAEVKEEQLTLDISRYAPGIYLLQMHDGKVMKVVKE